MKKQIKKLSLNKKTISNLSIAEMKEKAGGTLWGPGGCGGGVVITTAGLATLKMVTPVPVTTLVTHVDIFKPSNN